MRLLGFAKLLANFSWLSADRLIRLGCGLFVGIAIARQIGPTQFGILNFATAAVGIAVIAASLGLDQILQRDFVPTNGSDSDRLMSTALLLRMGAAIAIFLIYVWVLFLTTADLYTRSVCLVMAVTLLASPLTLFDVWFQSQVLAKHSFVAQNIAFTVTTFVRIVLLWSARASAFALAWVAVGEVFLGGVLLAFSYRRRQPRKWRWTWDGGLALTWLRESWAQLLSGLAVVIYMRIDQVMLQKMAGPEAVGIYSAAVRISEVGYFIPLALASTLLPSVIRSRTQDEREYARRRQHYFDISSVLGTSLALFTSLVAFRLVPALYGRPFEAAAGVLVVHAWSAVFVFTGMARAQYLLSEHLLRFSFYATAVGAALNILLNLLLIPRFGGIGAAAATLISYGLSAFGSSFFSRSVRPMGVQQLRSFFIPLALSRLWRERSTI